MPKLKPQTVKGMYDILPEEQKYWHFIISTFEEVIKTAGFYKIDTPYVEKSSLFERPIGKDTDVVEKEMYFLESHGSKQKEKLALRPEATASVARSYIEHGMRAQTQPVNLYYWGPMFRHDKPQMGRQRQFFQIGAESIGELDPALDAQLIAISVRLMNRLGINDYSVQVNSIGTDKSRARFIKKLKEYYKPYARKICKECQNRLKTNPLRLLDCKDVSCAKYKERAPQIVDSLDAKDKKHFTEVLEYLDELDISYELNTHLVRGLDYYTRTVFEIYPEIEKIKDAPQMTLGGGGRYDGLIELIGGKDTPGVGFSFGVERIIEVMKLKDIKIPHHDMPDIFMIQLGKLAKKKSLKIIDKLRGEGFKTVAALSKDSIKSQLKLADKLKAPVALIMGQKEVLDGTVILRDMSGGMQETVDWDNVVDEIKKRLPRDND